METLDYIILFASVFLSGYSFFLVKNPNQYFLKLLLAFSGAFLFALTVLHLMPEVYSSKIEGIGIWIMFGFLLQIIMEFFSQGIEHGHVHIHNHAKKAFPLSMMISLCLHSFLEAMPLASENQYQLHQHENEYSLMFGILLHHVPVAFALVSMLVGSGITKSSTVLYLLLFALMTPLGAFTSYFLGDTLLNGIECWFEKIMAIVIGIFLHISTTILFESGNDHRFNLYKIAAIISGGIFGLLVS